MSRVDPESDEALAARAQRDPTGAAGRGAAAELFRRHRDTIYLWCLRLVRDHEKALDLAQDVMLDAYRALASFEGRSRFTSWLFMIARHRCLRALLRPGLLHDPEVDPDDVAAEGDPSDRYEQDELEDRMLALIRDTLTPEEQRAVWLRCFERLPVDEITRVLGLDTATGARGLLQTARRKLRAALERGASDEASR